MPRITVRHWRATATTVLAATALFALSLGGGTTASAAAADLEAGGGTDAPAPVPAAPVMPDYSVEAYSAEAELLPPELLHALAEQLGETGEGYLANADAAADAAPVVEGLLSSGVDVLGTRLDGTRLVVIVPDGDAVAADLVEAANATPEFGASSARTTVDSAVVDDLQPLQPSYLGGGQGFVFGSATQAFICSVAFNGVSVTQGYDAFLTAGHCSVDGENSWVNEYDQDRPGDPDGAVGFNLGDKIPGTFAFGNEIDAGLVRPQTNLQSLPRVGTWNSGANNGPVDAGEQVLMRDYGDAVVGQQVCKSGSTTGWSCGRVQYVDQLIQVGKGGPQVNADIVKGMCSQPGDSGGSVISGPYAMGLVSAGSTKDACTPSGVTAVFPMTAPVVDGVQYGSVRSFERDWELMVDVPGVRVTSPEVGEPLLWGSALSGTVEGATRSYKVVVVIEGDDGRKTYTSSIAQDGSWSVRPTDLQDGFHRCGVYVTFGTQRGSGDDCGFVMTGAPTVERIAGADRYSGAVAIAQRAFPDTAPVVYVATGLNYPDALSAGPAAVAQGGPLLLVTQNEVPAVVADEIRSLQPERIVVVGGPNSVSAGVVSTLKTLVPGVGVERLSGADRYAASRAVVSAVFPEAAHSFAATGTNFPDALSAGGAAGSALEPVVLVNGSLPAADDLTLKLFRDLKAQSITVVGGPNSVSTGVADSLKTVPAAVERVSADNRYLTSIALNRASFETSGTVYLATGLNFPDALAGGVLAGLDDAPLYVVPTDCVPQGVLSDIGSLGATEVVLLGGPNSLSPAVQKLTACAS
ncbi:cell wall-binding repeat-containing protein [Herbiconiux sp. KACC 21604]|uniref:cell wall-binding repeat-containing protein n=1 Tax=unclassified Herbiconiux TaxID=2618217 RepID=UPI001490AAD3|nr:cell wall-binding repeat-containing protein [Herbiconiux sp. SALV-R1]QJU54907.1 hypothetical protein HL652_15650 [Herbiconiux sp. SALV-R1]WPO86031.1 cell wall-binding repeat-containing protein [Herbiconiux sp. KACC 21604]